MIHLICSVLAFHYCSISFPYEPLWHLVLLACKHFTQAVTEPDSLTKGMRSLWQESPSFCCSPQRSRGPTLQASILNPRYRISEERTQSQSFFSPNGVKAGGRCFSVQHGAPLLWVEHQHVSWNISLDRPVHAYMSSVHRQMLCYLAVRFTCSESASSSLILVWWISFWITEASWEQNCFEHFCSSPCTLRRGFQLHQ